MKSIIFYTPFWDYTVSSFVEKLKEVDSTEDVEILLNSPGGSVFAGWAAIAPMIERTGKNIVKVYGNAASMAFNFLLFADEVHALDVTEFMIHRADAYIETPEDQERLDNVNAQLRQKLTNRIDQKLFEQVTGKKIKDIFDSEKRINVYLTAKQMKKIGLVDKIIRVEKPDIKAYTDKFVAFVDTDTRGSVEELRGSNKQIETINNNEKTKKMTAEEIKLQHPAAYREILETGKAHELDRVNACLAYLEFDKKAVLDQIKSGNGITQAFQAEMQVKALAPKAIGDTVNETPKETKIDPEEPKEESEKDLKLKQESDEFEAKLRESAGLKVKEGK